MIDRNIFQILITDEPATTPPPDALRLSETSLRDAHPGHRYCRLGLDDLTAFIAANFDAETLACLHALKPYSFKANLGRYCLLLARGGIYADAVIRVLRPVEPADGKQMTCFRDTPGSGLWTVSTSLIAAAAGREEFKVAIDLIKANVARRHYGASPVHVSGPGVFGRALAIVDRIEDIDFGTFEYLGAERSPHSIGHVDGLGRIVSLRCKSGLFTELGLRGTNDYAHMWNMRRVYGETRRLFPAHHLHLFPPAPGEAATVVRGTGTVSFSAAAQGWIVFGPYTTIDPGTYRATFRFATDASLAGLRMDAIATDRGVSRTLAERTLNAQDAAAVSFSVSERLEGFEVRLQSPGGAQGTIIELDIEQLDGGDDEEAPAPEAASAGPSTPIWPVGTRQSSAMEGQEV